MSKKMNIKKMIQVAKKGFKHFCMASERQARISLLLAIVIVTSTFGSVSALNYRAQNSSMVVDSTEDIAPADTIITYEEFLELTDESSEFTGTYQTENYGEGYADYYLNQAMLTAPSESTEDDEDDLPPPAQMNNEQVVHMVTSGRRIKTIDRKDLDIGAASSGSSADLGNTAQNTVSSSSGTTATFNETNNFVIGIDVSGWNGVIDWQKVANYGVRFAIIKCGGRYTGSAKLYEDSKFRTNVRGAQANGIRVGVYFFSAATDAKEALEEASFTLDLIKGMSISYPVVIDWETAGGYRTQNVRGEALYNVLITFCETVKQAGYSAMAYMNQSDWNNRLGQSYTRQFAANYGVWLAAYFNKHTYTNTPFKVGDSTERLATLCVKYQIWQYGIMNKGVIPGIPSAVDVNLGFFSSEHLINPTIAFANPKYTTTVGRSITVTRGMTATSSISRDMTSQVSYVITNSSGNTVSLSNAINNIGNYTIKYSFNDPYFGTVTKSIPLEVLDSVPEGSELDPEDIPTESTAAPTSQNTQPTSSQPAETSSSTAAPTTAAPTTAAPTTAAPTTAAPTTAAPTTAAPTTQAPPPVDPVAEG